jgi:putative tryptophan/tyrosine transport system substrate-binding protein
VRRREFITLLSGAAAWPFGARAQQQMPVIGFLNSASPEGYAPMMAAFRQGLSEIGYVEGQNVAIEYRLANNELDRLPELAADLVRRRVAVIAASGGTAVPLAAKAATTTIPIVFGVGGDPVKFGFVASFNRPGGNVTGISFMSDQLVPKRVGLLHELVPGAVRFALLVNPTIPNTETLTRDSQAAASAIGRQIEVLTASTNRDIDLAFASLVQKQADALLVAPGVLFANRRVQLTTLAARHAVPAIYFDREFAEAGGLMSYGANISDVMRQLGIYTGRVLRGEKPADMPVMQPTKFELVINLQTAKTLGLEIPPALLARADEVIE